MTNRKYLNISNDNDDVILYLEEASQVGMYFLNAQDALYIIVQSQGYNGNKLPGQGTPIGNPIVFEYSYLSGDVGTSEEMQIMGLTPLNVIM